MIDALTRAGYILIPLKGKSKEPMHHNWPATLPGSFATSVLSINNYGIALSDTDLVVDVDPRNFKEGDNPLKRLVEKVGPLDDTFVVRTGGGGLHIFLKKSAGLKVCAKHEDFPGVDFKYKGGQVVGPGSIHPDTGKEYRVFKGAPSKVKECPQALLELIGRKAVVLNDKGVKEYKDDEHNKSRYREYLERTAPLAIQGEQGDHTTFKVVCFGRDLGLSPEAVYDILTEIDPLGEREGWNERCSPPWPGDQLRDKIRNAYRYANSAVGNRHPEADFAGVDIPPAPPSAGAEDKLDACGLPAVAEDKDAPGRELSWVTTKDGTPTRCFYNLLNYLKIPKGGLKNIFGYNEFTGQVEFTAPAPWHDKRRKSRGELVTDHDLKILKAYLVRKHGFEMPVTTIEEAVTVAAHDNKLHPVREWLLGLEWDKVSRIDNWLSVYAHVHDTAYSRACGRKLLCAAVARVLNPGCKFDHVVVLEGDQGIGKSMLCKILGGEWYGDFVVDPHNKDTIAALQGKWIVELSEMEVTKRADANALKAFISRQSDKVRLAYGRMALEFPRQCVFIGSINPEGDGTWLKDGTGNRRFWPVRIAGRVDMQGLKDVREQLFAEAVERLRAGESLYMDTKELEKDARTEAAERYSAHPWTEAIAAWIRANITAKGLNFVSSRDVFVGALGGLDKSFDHRSQIWIAGIMKSLGWEKTQGEDVGGHRVRGYVRKAEKDLLEGLA
jgi:predicted P-loop ATPase